MAKIRNFLVLFIFFSIASSLRVCVYANQDNGSYTNHLIHEKSPYLLQHAHNPVDWYPWGEEAFAKARQEDKPIFLSIGYSTCHWCHVMEEESFSNPEIAKIMNKNFVSIKVDREERPDIDNIYMQAVMAMTGSGGWPMSIFVTPDLKPFFGGTYFPPEDRWGTPGLKTIFNTIAEKWKTEKQEILKSSDALTEAIAKEAQSKVSRSHTLDENTLKKAYEQFLGQFDPQYGGFGGAPKFPRGHALSFLLRYWKRTQDAKALEMVEKTLEEMAKGGMYDHIGGGFHRYSTDDKWRVPHFEKMLYDQAIISKAYLEAYQATGKAEYAQLTRDIFGYVLRDMTAPEGAFYSAEDADSLDPLLGKKSEGAFYLWSSDEIEKELGRENAAIFNFYFGVEPQRKNILYVAKSLDETASQFKKSPEEIKNIIRKLKEILFEIRSKRSHPHLDDKVLTDWNGLMISSLAFGSRVLNEPRYEEAARKAADFILAKMKRNDGRLMHRYRDGEVAIEGFIDDYAFFINGLVDLYEATFDPRYLEEAQFFSKEMIRLFWDKEKGGFFFSAQDAEKLISRSKELYDGAIPSGNSVAVLTLLRVGRLTMDQEMEKIARKTLEAFSEELGQSPLSYPQMLMALDFAIGPSREIVIAGDERKPEARMILKEIYRNFIPNKVVELHPSDKLKAGQIEKLSPFLKNQNSREGKIIVYVCKNYVCNVPTSDVNKLDDLLQK